MTEREGSIRVLLVDDETEFLESMAKALSRRGFVVLTAASGTEGQAMAEAEPLDVAVLDVKMPDIDGYELFRRVRKAKPSLPILILTGHGTIDKAFELSKGGVFDYLAKPVEVEKLAEALLRAAAETGRVPTPGRSGVHVLLVDDEEDFCRSMAKVLGRRGLVVHTAWSGEEALEVLKKQKVEVAVVDVRMPGMGGHALLAKLRETDPLVEVILLTGHATVDSAMQGMKQGAFDYLLKPQDPVELAAKIHAAAEHRFMKQADRRAKDANDALGKGPD
ncbi:MAG: response regulator [Planctomycetes bacterium]|jgi:DNA-binding NtrC family response regulator|nr:response regulator [Planctomycetota bacterium]